MPTKSGTAEIGHLIWNSDWTSAKWVTVAFHKSHRAAPECMLSMTKHQCTSPLRALA